MSEVSGSSRERQAAMVQQRLRGATPHPRSGAAAERSHAGARGQGRQPRGATPCLRPEEARRSHLTPEARGAGREEQPEGQPEEWWWHGCRRA